MKFIRVLKSSSLTFDKSGYYDLTNESDFKPIIAEFMERIKYTFPKNIYDSSAGIDEKQFNDFKSDFKLKIHIIKDNETNKFSYVDIWAQGTFIRSNGHKSMIYGSIDPKINNKVCDVQAQRTTQASYAWATSADDVKVSGACVRNIFNNNFTKLNEKNVKYAVEFLFDLMYDASKEWIERQLGAAKNTYQGD